MPAPSATPIRAPKPAAPREGLLTLEEAAAYLQVAPGTLKHWAAWRRIEHVKVGKYTRFTRDMLERYIAKQTVAASVEGL
jgi:excisionase family DNA binding protein